MLLPFERPLPLTGLEWTAQKLKTKSLIENSSSSYEPETEDTKLLSKRDEETAEQRQIEINLMD